MFATIGPFIIVINRYPRLNKKKRKT